MNLGDTARNLRETFGITQRAAADLLGISYVHLCNLENNKSRPSPEMLEKFRDVFGVDLYVYSWCSSPELDGLPTGMKSATRQMTEVWQKVIDQKRRAFQNQG
jgi:transcriptional regulator with XRE-family HTH domain